MIAQIKEHRGFYIVQVMFTDLNGYITWENVETFKSEGKAKRFKEHLQNSDYKSVSEIYRSDYYRELSKKRL